MWVVVEFTHRAGVKLGPGQAHPRGPLEGEIVSYTVGQARVSAVALKCGLNVGSDLAVMYRPRLVGIGSDVFRLSGLERWGEPRAWVHQEWICTLRRRPDDPPGEPTRNRRP